MNELVLKIENLSLSFEIDENYYQAINNISMNFYKGKMHAIVGESGCGKTISMMSILSLLPKNARIDTGKIIFKDFDLTKLKEFEMQNIRGKKIALIPQDPMTSLNPLYTIQNQLLETILLHNDISREDGIKLAKKVLKDVEIRDIDKVLKSYPHELSGGMKQRIIIAMALSSNAEIIIADEPTTALDVTIQAQILELLDKIKKEGKTIILITHNLGIVSKYCDDIYIMYSGKIVEYSKTKDLFNKPKHPYTKALLNAIPNKNSKERLENIEGSPKTITETIEGCIFNPRCKCVFDKCRITVPELISLENNSKVACLLYLR